MYPDALIFLFLMHPDALTLQFSNLYVCMHVYIT